MYINVRATIFKASHLHTYDITHVCDATPSCIFQHRYDPIWRLCMYINVCVTIYEVCHIHMCDITHVCDATPPHMFSNFFMI